MPRRTPGTLLPLEVSILAAGLDLQGADDWFHGFLLASHLSEAPGGAARALTAHGTLYKALGRLAAAGLLESEWEDADAATAAGRPRRRLYRVTPDGAVALAAARAASTAPTSPIAANAPAGGAA